MVVASRHPFRPDLGDWVVWRAPSLGGRGRYLLHFFKQIRLLAWELALQGCFLV